MLVITGDGLNCERETAAAFELAGGEPELVHISDILRTERRLWEFQILALIGGFSNGDHLGAGTVQASRFRHTLRRDFEVFVSEGRPVIGICNGFQTLVKMGILPGLARSGILGPGSPGRGSPGPVLTRPGPSRLAAGEGDSPPGVSAPGASAATHSEDAARAWREASFGPALWVRNATVMSNDSGHFEDRWVDLVVDPGSPCIWTSGIERLFLPVRHGEGKFWVRDAELLEELLARRQVVLRYCDPEGKPTQAYPWNPNGSPEGVAGICDPSGTVFGLMPHPEAFLSPWNHPSWTRDSALGRPLAAEGQGVALFRNAVRFVRERRP